MVVGENKRNTNIMDGIENTGDVRLHDHRLRLKQRFDIVRKLGQGTYGKVQLGINKKTGQEVAIKTIKKCKIESEADLIRIRREVQIMSSVRHPNIVHIYEVFENSEKMILVMEYCSGGELYDYLSQKKVLQEDEARRLFRQIATAVYYCHIHKICHRDLKLENVLLDDTGSAKIADFGLSNVFKETSLLSTFCGSPLYASPEIVKGTPYIGPEVDCWSLGVLLYTLVYGAMPFDGSNFKRLVRQISNGDYYEPKNPSSASSLIRDMLTVDPLKRADIAYICDHPWVNIGESCSCLEEAESLAAQTPVRLDLLLSLAPPATRALVVPAQGDIGPEESSTDLTNSTSMAVEPSNSAEKRILDLVAEGGEDAIKPSPTRTIVSAGENKRKLELAVSSSGLQRKKERVTSGANLACALPEESAPLDSPPPLPAEHEPSPQPALQPSATVTLASSPPAETELVRDATKEIVKEQPPKEEVKEKTPVKPRVTVKKKISPTKSLDEKSFPEKQEEPKQEESKPSSVSAAAEKLTSLSLSQPSSANQTPTKPKKFSIPGGSVGSFKEQFERRASLTTTPEVKRSITKPVSKLAKGKSQSEERELTSKPIEGNVTLQQIGIEPAQANTEELNRGGVKKTESEPSHSSTSSDPSLLLQDARRSLQNSMAKLVEEKQSEDSRRRAARDIISTAIRTGKPPVPYGRSSSAGVASLGSATPPTAAAAAAAAASPPRLYRTEAHHVVDDHRARGVSVERIIPINMSSEENKPVPPPPQPQPAQAKPNQMPLRRLVSTESTGSTSEAGSSSGEPIKKSAREFIIPIAVEGKGYVTPRQRSLEPSTPSSAQDTSKRIGRTTKHRRISSLVSGGESEEEDDTHMHRLRSSRAARAESVSSGEEDEEDEGFHLLTAENLFSTLLHRVRALTNRLNGEEGPGFPQHPHSLFNNLQSPFFNSPHLPRRNLLREGWGSRDLHADFDSMFNKSRQQMPRGSSKKAGKSTRAPRPEPEQTDDVALDLSDLDLSAIQFSEREMRALSGLTPALSRRLQQQLLAHLPPAAASSLRRTLSLSAPAPEPAPAAPHCSTLPRPPRSTPRSTPERPLLSKYLTPERALSLDDSYCSDGGSAASDAASSRHCLRLAADQPRKRISRFLRPDFFDTPPDESLYAKHKKEKELETQKILREIREKKNRSLEATPVMSPTEMNDIKLSFKDDSASYRKCLSPVSVLPVKDRSRSTTPFFPILDNIKETILDSPSKSLDLSTKRETIELNKKSKFEDSLVNKDSRLMRPKSYPVKVSSTFDEPKQNEIEKSSLINSDSKDLDIIKESKLLRPKSYPTSSPSPEKIFISRNIKKEESKSNNIKEEDAISNSKNDVEVSFSISLPRKKSVVASDSDSISKKETTIEARENTDSNITMKKYQVTGNGDANSKTDTKQHKTENGNVMKNGTSHIAKASSNDENNKVEKREDVKIKSEDFSDKKTTIKKKIIRKVSSKTKADAGSSAELSENKGTEKKKVTKKVKEKSNEDSKNTTSTKKKSMLQSIGQKFEKFTSTKSSSCEKSSDTNVTSTSTKKESKISRNQREQSVPVNTGPCIETNLIKRAATLTDVAALDTPEVSTPSKTTVSKVLGLFKKFDSKEKMNKPPVIKSLSLNEDSVIENRNNNIQSTCDFDGLDKDKPKRPTSLLLNGMSKKNKQEKSSSDNAPLTVTEDDVQNVLNRKDNTCKESRNNLKLDFSRLPRVKKIVPTNSVIEPQIINHFDDVKGDKKSVEKKSSSGLSMNNSDEIDTCSRSRSRSRSTISNTEVKSDHSHESKLYDRNPMPPESFSQHPLRNHESTTPEKEDIVDRIRRKSFYSRFNEKKLRRKSSLVGPGATEYDPVARLHSQSSDSKYDLSPTSPGTYDLSPGFSVTSDLSPSTERYRSLLSEHPVTARSSMKYDNYGLNDKIDTYRSLDRSELRKYPGSRSYLDYDQPLSYGTHRYSRTKSLLDSSDGADSITDHSLGHLREPLKYNRTISMYTPGNYATYRPKKTRNSAIILKESEKEPSPENILDKIRNRKTISISVTRKPSYEKDPLPRSSVTSKSEGNSSKCPEKVD